MKDEYRMTKRRVMDIFGNAGYRPKHAATAYAGMDRPHGCCYLNIGMRLLGADRAMIPDDDRNRGLFLFLIPAGGGETKKPRDIADKPDTVGIMMTSDGFTYVRSGCSFAGFLKNMEVYPPDRGDRRRRVWAA